MRTSGKKPLWISLAFVMVMLVGCDRGPARISIHGAVTYKGEPIAQGTIDFIPKDGSATREAAPIVNGQYATLADHGLIAGEYHVSITAPAEPTVKPDPNTPPGAPKRTKELLPEEYNRNTKLMIDVTTDGKREFDFVLK
jgi:hypothetical protein